MKFSTTLRDLKIYFEFTEWLQKHVLSYVQKSESLQDKKTLLLKLSSSNKDRQRKNYSDRTFLKNFTNAKLKFYNQIQKSFARFIFFIHFDCIRTLYADIDAFKQEEFDAMIYHGRNKEEYSKIENSKIFDVQY